MKKLGIFTYWIVCIGIIAFIFVNLVFDEKTAKADSEYNSVRMIYRYKTKNSNCVPFAGSSTDYSYEADSLPLIFYKCGDEVVVVALNH